MFEKASKQQVVTSIFIWLWIFIINISTPLITSAPPWPMYFVTIFFFLLGGDPKKIKSIYLSGIVGICGTYITLQLLKVLGPIIGMVPALLILLLIVLGLIIVGGNFFPLFFNNMTFAFLTVCTINFEIIESSFVNWILMFLIGGTIILGGALLIAVLVGKRFEKKANA